MKTIEIDPAKMLVTHQGVKPFFWPMGRPELVEATKVILGTVIQELRTPVSARETEALLLSTLSTKLTRMLISTYFGSCLVRRFRDSPFRLDAPKRTSIWRALNEEVAFPPYDLAVSLPLGVGNSNLLKYWLRPFKDLFKEDVFTRKPLEFCDLQSEIVSVISCPLSRIHAEFCASKPTLVNLGVWFYPPRGSSDVRPLDDLPLTRHLLEVLSKNLSEVAGPIPEVVIGYLYEWVRETGSWVQFYRNRLKTGQLNRRIPNKLWIGTAGIVWNRMLADEVLSRGGSVTGHDHAMGANYSEIDTCMYTESQSCDEFYTFSNAQAIQHERRAKELSISGAVPKMVVVDRPLNFAKQEIGKQARDLSAKEAKSIMVLTPLYPDDMLGPHSLLPTPVIVDWQARLFSSLVSGGYKVVHKPHPETEFPWPDHFSDDFDVQAITGRFEECYLPYDIFIFDYARTTTFGFILQTKKPVILIDFGFTALTPEDQELLSRRCVVIKGWFDGDNRAQIEFAELAGAIEKAPNLVGDRSYISKIMGW